MKFKKLRSRITALVMLLSFVTTTAFADINLGNDDGTGFSSGTDNNYWGVYTDSGTKLYDTEGLRVTVYDAETNSKVFNTIDISGNSNISAVSNIYYFADGSELIPKTTWLIYIGNIYNSVSESDMGKFNICKIGLSLMLNATILSASNIFWGIACMIAAISMPKILREFLVPTGGDGHVMNSISQTVHITSVAKNIFTK